MLGFEGYSAAQIVIAASVLYVPVVLVYTAIYNVFFHPLAHVPGPKLAGATYLYQTYFCFAGGSRYYMRIKALHDIYGPLVRITPDEVHLSDPDNYELINYVGSKYGKSALYDAFGIGYSTFSSRSNEVHRVRRSALNPFFSRKMVLELEGIVQSKAEKLVALANKAFSSGQPLVLHYAFRSISVDVITDYAFGQCYDLLDTGDLGKQFFEMVQGIGPTMWIFQQWPGLQKIALSMPPAVASFMSPPVGQVLRLTEHCRKQCVAVKEAMDSGRAEGRPSIFQALLSPHEKDPSYKIPTVDNLKDEAYSVLAASADTTGNAMTVCCYGVTSNPEIYEKVKKELEAEFPNPNEKLEFVRLETLPYLTAVIKEGLRLSYGVPGRLPRDVPEGGATFNGVFIPGGSVVSMSSWVLHQDPEYFPDPTKFDPNRWLDQKEARRIDKAFVPFGKGTRGCVGKPLAYCELYVSLGTLFRRFPNMKPNVLTPEDLEYDDYFSAYNTLQSTKFSVTSKV